MFGDFVDPEHMSNTVKSRIAAQKRLPVLMTAYARGDRLVSCGPRLRPTNQVLYEACRQVFRRGSGFRLHRPNTDRYRCAYTHQEALAALDDALRNNDGSKAFYWLQVLADIEQRQPVSASH